MEQKNWDVIDFKKNTNYEDFNWGSIAGEDPRVEAKKRRRNNSILIFTASLLFAIFLCYIATAFILAYA